VTYTSQIKELRAAANLSQAALAALVGVSPRQISRYESGGQQPTLAVAGRIADALDCSVDGLMGREALA
jgi:transcriptional regulator with XRE-family HTH domain